MSICFGLIFIYIHKKGTVFHENNPNHNRSEYIKSNRLRRMDGQQTDLPDIVTNVSLALHFYLVKRNSTFFYYKILLFTRSFMCFYLKT